MKKVFKVFVVLFLGLVLTGCGKETENGNDFQEEKGWLDSIHTVNIFEPKFGNQVNFEDSEKKFVITYINVSLTEAKTYVNENKVKFQINPSVVDNYEENKIYKFTGFNGRSDATFLLDNNTFTITIERR